MKSYLLYKGRVSGQNQPSKRPVELHLAQHRVFYIKVITYTGLQLEGDFSMYKNFQGLNRLYL